MKYFLIIVSMGCSLGAFPLRLSILEKKKTLPFQEVVIYHEVHLPQSIMSLLNDISHISDSYKECVQQGSVEFLIEFPPKKDHALIEEIHMAIHNLTWRALHTGQLIFALGDQASTKQGFECLDERTYASFLAFYANVVKNYFFNYSVRYSHDVVFAFYKNKHVSISVGEVLRLWQNFINKLIEKSALVEARLKKSPFSYAVRLANFKEELYRIRMIIDNAVGQLADEYNKAWSLFISERAYRAYASLGSSATQETFNGAFDKEMGSLKNLFDFFLSDAFRDVALDVLFLAKIVSSTADTFILYAGMDHGEHITSVLKELSYECRYDSLVTLCNGQSYKDMNSIAQAIELMRKPISEAAIPLAFYVYAYPAVYAQALKELRSQSSKAQSVSNQERDQVKKKRHRKKRRLRH